MVFNYALEQLKGFGRVGFDVMLRNALSDLI